MTGYYLHRLEAGFHSVDRIHVAQDRVFVSMVINLRVHKNRKFLDRLSYHQVLKKENVLWT